MDRADTAAIAWMAQYRRNPYPDRVVWRQEETMVRPSMYWLEVDTATARPGMSLVARREGNRITVERSDYLYTSKVSEYQALGYSEEDAAVEAARWVAPPRQSEHNAGLAIDVVSRDYDQVYGDLMHEFEDFPAFTWLSEHCAEFGFILRYPEDKQEITGITYEPWHYRYVGVEHAQKMQELDLCLEEYWDYLLDQ